MGSGFFSSAAAGAASSCGHGEVKSGRMVSGCHGYVYDTVRTKQARFITQRRAGRHVTREIANIQSQRDAVRGMDVPPRARGRRREPSSGTWPRICCVWEVGEGVQLSVTESMQYRSLPALPEDLSLYG